MYERLAIIGDKESILPFKAFGVVAFETERSETAKPILQKLVKEKKFGIVFITEELAKELEEQIKSIRLETMFPIITEIPSRKGVIGVGLQKMKKTVERAIGADILFKKE